MSAQKVTTSAANYASHAHQEVLSSNCTGYTLFYILLAQVAYTYAAKELFFSAGMARAGAESNGIGCACQSSAASGRRAYQPLKPQQNGSACRSSGMTSRCMCLIALYAWPDIVLAGHNNICVIYPDMQLWSGPILAE